MAPAPWLGLYSDCAPPIRLAEFLAAERGTFLMWCWSSKILATRRLVRNTNRHLAGLERASKRVVESVSLEEGLLGPSESVEVALEQSLLKIEYSPPL